VADFGQVHAALRGLMLRAATGMIVATDTPERLEMLAPWPAPRRPEAPMWFGAVRVGRAYVSFHLMPIYTNPDLAAAVTPALRSRMQGKSCFNFKAVAPQQLAELEVLTRRCAEAWARPSPDATRQSG
jgi:hypothetical protein